LNPRWQAIVELCPRIEPIVDVGADHGRVAKALGAFAVERHFHRIAGPGQWVVADGLKPFREVGTAIIAGMGARRIAAILEAGPAPTAAVVHAQDDPGWLRGWLAQNGWQIDEEAVVPEGQGFAEIQRIYRGIEPSSGLELFFGPRLLAGDHPHRAAWLAHLQSIRQQRWERIPAGHPDRKAVQQEIDFLKKFEVNR